MIGVTSGVVIVDIKLILSTVFATGNIFVSRNERLTTKFAEVTALFRLHTCCCKDYFTISENDRLIVFI